MTPTERFAITLDLIEAAEQMLRQRLRREHPEPDPAAIEARVDAWYLERIDDGGDAEGVAVPWPRP